MSDEFTLSLPAEAEMQYRISGMELPGNPAWKTSLAIFMAKVAEKDLSPEGIVKAWDEATAEFDYGFFELCEVFEDVIEALFQDEENVVVVLDAFYLPMGNHNLN